MVQQVAFGGRYLDPTPDWVESQTKVYGRQDLTHLNLVKTSQRVSRHGDRNSDIIGGWYENDSTIIFNNVFGHVKWRGKNLILKLARTFAVRTRRREARRKTSQNGNKQ